MDAQSAANCLLRVALKWPSRYLVLREFVDVPIQMEPASAALWQAVGQAVQEELPPTAEAFRERVLYTAQQTAPAYRGNCQAYVNYIAGSEEPSENYCVRLLRQHAADNIIRSVPDAVDEDALTGMQDRVDRALSAFSPGISTTFIDLFPGDGSAVLSGREILPCPNFLMTGFGGLFSEGRLLYTVMPRKAGKTLSALQLSRDLIMDGHTVLYMNFEQEYRGDLSTRIGMLASESEADIWKGVNRYEDLPRDVYARLEQNRPAWDSRFLALTAEELADDQAMQRGADSIQQLIQEECIQAGRPIPSMVIVDWWGELWERCRAYLKSTARFGLSDGELRRLEIQHFKKLKLMAQLLGTRVLVYNQIRGQVAGKITDARRLSVNDAAENSSLGNMADAGIVSGTKDEQAKTVHFRLEFSRFSEAEWIAVMHMNGKAQVFERMDSELEADGEPSADMDNVMEDMGSVFNDQSSII